MNDITKGILTHRMHKAEQHRACIDVCLITIVYDSPIVLINKCNSLIIRYFGEF